MCERWGRQTKPRFPAVGVLWNLLIMTEPQNSLKRTRPALNGRKVIGELLKSTEQHSIEHELQPIHVISDISLAEAAPYLYKNIYGSTAQRICKSLTSAISGLFFNAACFIHFFPPP